MIYTLVNHLSFKEYLLLGDLGRKIESLQSCFIFFVVSLIFCVIKVWKNQFWLLSCKMHLSSFFLTKRNKKIFALGCFTLNSQMLTTAKNKLMLFSGIFTVMRKTQWMDLQSNNYKGASSVFGLGVVLFLSARQFCFTVFQFTHL